jgi:hypothetical protein
MLFVETRRINYHAVGVEVGLQYHILIIEAALDLIRKAKGKLAESLILLVDSTSEILAAPPPMSALQGLVSLLQLAYPDRMHKIIVGPLNIALRGLYRVGSRFMCKRSRDKIQLIHARPSPITVGPSLAAVLDETQTHPQEKCENIDESDASTADVGSDNRSDLGYSDGANSVNSDSAVQRVITICDHSYMPVDEQCESSQRTRVRERAAHPKAQSPCFFMFACCQTGSSGFDTEHEVLEAN